MRPIISTIGTVTYEIAKKLDKIIKPFIHNDYMVNSSVDFVNKLKIIVQTNKQAFSLDVENLFTNVPVKDTIDVIINEVFLTGGWKTRELSFRSKSFLGTPPH